MIYLTFDSNIWIYSLNDSWKVENQLDYLEDWIEQGYIKLLLPEIIIKEWKKNRDERVKERQTKLKEFFEMAEEILPSAFYSDYKESTVQEAIIENQLARIEYLLDSSEIIPTNPKIEGKVIETGIAKKAPLHKKSSVADAIIIFSLFDFAETHQDNEFFFVSANTEDFYKKENRQHVIDPYLKPDFDRLNIKAFTNLNHLIQELKPFQQLPFAQDINLRKQNRIKNKIKKQAFNPEYEKITVNQESSFILNLETIDFILSKPKPTKEQIIFVLALMDSAPDLEEKFYGRLQNKNWFRILKAKGVFKYENNPSPIQVEKGFQVPLWLPLLYLEKLSIQIKDGTEINLADEIIEIIKNVSENPKDNYRTWYSFITILKNLPNEKIPKDIFKFIPIWLKSKFDSTHLSAEICKGLILKFLSDLPTNEDINKAEFILRQLFIIEEAEKISPENEQNFIFRIGNYAIDILVDKNIISRIAKYCSNELIYQIANNLKAMIFNFPFRINLTINSNNQEFTLKATTQDNSLNLQLTANENPSTIIAELKIENFEQFNDNQTRRKILDFLKKENINIKSSKENSPNLKYFINNLIHGTNYRFRIYSINQITDRTFRREIEANFALVFRDLLDQKAKQTPLEALKLLKSFAFDNTYRAAFYKKVVLYVIKENWQKTKSLFWELVKDDDKDGLFSNSSYNDDLYELLNRNQQYLTRTEIQKLEKIINQ